jgi:hypothetical protein
MKRFIGALLMTYFLSRALRALGLNHPPLVKLLAAHAVSLVAIFLLLFSLRYPLYVFYKDQMIVYVVCQVIWLAYDLYRSNVAFWRAPVAQPTESSARRRGANSP